MKAPIDVSLSLIADSFTGQTSLRVAPQPKWNVFMMFSVHTDIGYTASQEECLRILTDNILLAADWCQRRRDLPESERHRWHVEGSLLLDTLAQKDPKNIEKMAGLFRDGLMELDAEYANVHTGVCSAESLIRYLYSSANLERKFGIPVRAASLTDVPSYTWAIPSLLSGAGVHFLSVGQNGLCGGIRNPGYPLFYWEGPDGSKVLTANSNGYARLTIDGLFGKPWAISEKLLELSAQGYPFDAYLFHGLYVDNVKVEHAAHEAILRSIEQWNRTWAYPQLSCSTVEQYGRYMEKKFGDRIPTVRGHWGDDWEDGVASAALEMGINRRNHELLPACETFAAWASSGGLLPAYPMEQFRNAWRNVSMFDEHTWGASTSISQPEGEMARSQWAVKSAFANDAAAQARNLWQEVSGALTQGIPRPAGHWAAVMNPLSWNRTEPVRLNLPPALARIDTLHVIDAKTEKEAPCQRDGLQLVFLASEVPSVGYKLFRIEQGAGNLSPQPKPSDKGTIENEFYRAVVDLRLGGLAGLTDKQLNRELVDTKSGYGLNEYVHDPQGFSAAWRRANGKGGDARRPKEASLVRTAQGPVFSNVVCQTAVEGTPRIQQEMILYRGLKRVDFVNRIEKQVNYKPEMIYYAFPLDLHKPQFTLGLPGATAKIEQDLMNCANRNWFAVEHWVDVRSDQWGATWATVEAPLVCLGGISRRWIPHIPGDQGWLFSLVMGNIWGTNFHAGQGGKVTFRYALTSNAGSLDRVAACRFGAEVSNPLECVYLDQPSDGKLPAGEGCFCSIQPDNVMVQVIKGAEDGRGIIVRLREVAGKPTDARLTFPLLSRFSACSTDLVERDGKLLLPQGTLLKVHVPANGWATLRIR